MTTLLAALLSLCGCGPRPAAETKRAEAEQPPPVAASESPVPDREEPTDIFAPFSVPSQLQVDLPDHLYAGGFERRGGGVAPVNTTEEDRDFFTDAAFDKEGNTGRLFCAQVALYNRYEPKLPERSVAFICWKPIATGGTESNDGPMLAQLLPWRDGCSIYEVTTDGRRLRVQFEPAYGTKNPGRPLDLYVWKGDRLGHGRFVPENNKPFPDLKAAAPSPFEQERERGFRAVTDRQYDEAVDAFTRAIKLKPGDAASHYGLGLAHTGPGQPAGSDDALKAIASFSRALELDPQRTEAWRERSVRYWMEKQYDKAVRDASQVIALEPKEPAGYVLRAQFHAASGAHDRAAADVLKAARLDPEEREYWEVLALHQYHAGRYPDAVKSAERALHQDDARNVARVVLACIYARQGDAEKALKQIRAAYDNGITYDERQDGLRELKRAIAVRPNSPALKAAYEALSGPDKLEPSED